MSAAEVLAELESRQVAVLVEGGRLFLRPADRVSPDLIAHVRSVKPALLALLRPSPATTPATPASVAARVASFRATGSPWVLVPALMYEAGRCFSCGEPNPDVIYGRCLACSEALWRVLMQEDGAPWPGRPQ
jgi:hypothetical protein